MRILVESVKSPKILKAALWLSIIYLFGTGMEAIV